MAKSEKKELLPIKLSYNFDAFLMHLIQDYTKRPSADILNFFHELCTQVAEVGYAKKTGHGIHKKLHDYFPGTSIPFHLELKGHESEDNEYDHANKKWIRKGQKFFAYADIGFPSQSTHMKEDMLSEIATFIMERDLLGAELPSSGMPDFPRPEVKSSKMYIDLMNSFTGRPVIEKARRKKAEDVDSSAGQTST